MNQYQNAQMAFPWFIDDVTKIAAGKVCTRKKKLICENILQELVVTFVMVWMLHAKKKIFCWSLY